MHTLFLGNGFDLYHGLKTSYMDFLTILKDVSGFDNAISYYLNPTAEYEGDFKKFESYFGEEIDGKTAHKMCKILDGNSWAYYYANCNANIVGWIDFENEMIPALELIRTEVIKDYSFMVLDGIKCPEVTTNSHKERSLLSLWKEFFKPCLRSRFVWNIKYFNETYGILKDKIIQKLERDLDDFILAFIIYLKQFVENKKINEYEWIKKLNPNAIVSFNYTLTEKAYFPSVINGSCSHIHGLTKDGNLVFGTDLIEDDDVDFMHFSKKFQRFTKVSDFSYMDYIEQAADFAALFNNGDCESMTVSFIGCSLDKNDASIFKKYIELADSVNVYCYGFDGYRNVVRNLISIFSPKTIGEYLHGDKYGPKLKFYDIKGVAVDEDARLIDPKEYYRNLLENI